MEREILSDKQKISNIYKIMIQLSYKEQSEIIYAYQHQSEKPLTNSTKHIPDVIKMFHDKFSQHFQEEIQ